MKFCFGFFIILVSSGSAFGEDYGDYIKYRDEYLGIKTNLEGVEPSADGKSPANPPTAAAKPSSIEPSDRDGMGIEISISQIAVSSSAYSYFDDVSINHAKREYSGQWLNLGFFAQPNLLVGLSYGLVDGKTKWEKTSIAKDDETSAAYSIFVRSFFSKKNSVYFDFKLTQYTFDVAEVSGRDWGGGYTYYTSDSYEVNHRLVSFGIGQQFYLHKGISLSADYAALVLNHYRGTGAFGTDSGKQYEQANLQILPTIRLGWSF